MTQVPIAAKLTFADVRIGDIFAVERTFSEEDVAAFARISGDFSPLHVDDQYARTTEFGRCVVHGMLLASLFSQLVGMRIPGKHALYLGQDLAFRKPVLVGDTVHAIAKVTSKSEATRTIVLTTEIRSADDKVAVSGTAKVKVRGAEPGEAPLTAVSVGPKSTAVRRSKVAIVTGGSRGIGAGVAKLLAAKGYAVAVNYFRDEEAVFRVVSEITQSGGVAWPVRADVRDAGQVEQMIAEIAARLGPPTALVNGAIGEFGQSVFDDLSWERFLEQLEYQVKAVAQVCRAVHPHMKTARAGAIVNILSQVTGGVPPPRMADYVTAKYALAGLSKALAAEWAEDGIRVNMVSPSLLATDLTQHYHERVFRMEASRTPLKRLASVADVANTIAYLLSEEAGFLTGVNLFVTGGQVMP